jgi:dihydroneopterin aldolase
MTAMLGSVRTADDAARLAEAGVDIVDLVDATPATTRAAAGRVGAATLCASPPAEGADAAGLTRLAGAGAALIKIGWRDGADSAARCAGLAQAAGPARLYVAIPADRAGDLALLDALAGAGVAGAMIEPSGRESRALLDRASLAQLRRFVAECRARGLQSGLSGALEPPDAPRLLALAPDVIGFRRALGAEGALDLAAAARLRVLIPRGGAAPAAISAAAGVDRVFVRDLVVDMRIGVYAREAGARQPVRFTVEVEVARPAGRRAEFRDVFSYDLITDRIRMMAESEHHDLVESVAEAVAEAALAHPRAVSVTVRVEKLAVVAGSVGVEIVRRRA